MGSKFTLTPSFLSLCCKRRYHSLWLIGPSLGLPCTPFFSHLPSFSINFAPPARTLVVERSRPLCGGITRLIRICVGPIQPFARPRRKCRLAGNNWREILICLNEWTVQLLLLLLHPKLPVTSSIWLSELWSNLFPLHLWYLFYSFFPCQTWNIAFPRLFASSHSLIRCFWWEGRPADLEVSSLHSQRFIGGKETTHTERDINFASGQITGNWIPLYPPHIQYLLIIRLFVAKEWEQFNFN